MMSLSARENYRFSFYSVPSNFFHFSSNPALTLSLQIVYFCCQFTNIVMWKFLDLHLGTQAAYHAFGSF